MEAERLRIINVLKIEHLDIKLGKITRISGKNDTGKSCTLEAVKSLIQGGTDATLLREGAEEGEVVLILDDGLELRENLAPGKQERTVIHPQLGPVRRPKTFIDSLITPSSFNPAEFLTAKGERQKELALQAIPVSVTAEQLQEATGYKPAFPIPAMMHGLQAIASHQKTLYDTRTNVNRDLKQATATVKSLQESLPEDPAEGDWPSEISHLEEALETLEFAHRTKSIACQRETGEALRASAGELESCIAARKDAVQREIDAIRQALNADLSELAHHAVERDDNIRAQSDAAQKSLDDLYVPQREALLTEKSHAQTMVDQHVRAESACKLLEKNAKQASMLKTESERLTAALKNLDAFKAEVTATLPIADLEIGTDGLIYKGFPLHRNAESSRVMLAVELAALQAGKLGLILVDGVECLDSSTQALLEEVIRSKPGIRAILARTTEDETLTVTTEDGHAGDALALGEASQPPQAAPESTIAIPPLLNPQTSDSAQPASQEATAIVRSEQEWRQAPSEPLASVAQIAQLKTDARRCDVGAWKDLQETLSRYVDAKGRPQLPMPVFTNIRANIDLRLMEAKRRGELG